MKEHFKNYRRVYFHFIVFLAIITLISMLIELNKDDIGYFELIGLNFTTINISIIIVFSLVATIVIFKFYNSKRVFEVKLSTYGEYHPIIWRIFRYVFFYKKVSLKHLPIYIQMKLINEGFFEFENYYDSVVEDDTVKVDVIVKGDYSSDTVLFLVQDSYDIKLNELPENLLKHTSVVFDRNGKNENRRLYTRDMVKQVDNIINTLPSNVRNIELFMNTNPLTTLKLSKNCFFTGGRKRLKFNVYQYQMGESWLGPKAEF